LAKRQPVFIDWRYRESSSI